MAFVRYLVHKSVVHSSGKVLPIWLRPLSTTNNGRQNTSTTNPPLSKLNINFDDTVVAFKGKTTWELIRAYLVYQLLSVPFIVKHNLTIMKYTRKILGNTLFGVLMKMTFYGHFVAGENEETIAPVLKRMYSFGVGSILDYSVEEDIPHETAEDLEKKALEDPKTDLPQYKVPSEHLDRREKVVSARTFFYESEAVCDRNMEIFLRCIECASNSTYNTGMSAIKLTALCRPKLLLQISEVITKSRHYLKELGNMSPGVPVIQQGVTKEKLEMHLSSAVQKTTEIAEKFVKSITSDKEGVIHLFPWSGILNDDFDFNETFKVPDLKTGEMVRFMSQLTGHEMEQFRNMIRRLNTVIRAGQDLNVQIMVDAEQTYFQPAISRLTVELMRKYNKNKGIVYNTYQNYLLGAYNEVVGDLEQARRQNFYFRCKLVRGAYMEQERERAAQMNYPDPIQPNYKATSDNYHKTLTECLKRIKQLKDNGVTEKKIAILVASHNEDTVRLAVQKMEEIGIAPNDGTIMFGQLYGMCDFISYSLGSSGYGIYKYVPYGPVNEVLPYLSRRAVENRGILQNIVKEKKMLKKAIFSRLKTFDMNRNPVGPVKPPSNK
ncbi:hypothetical protein RUM43_005931 [Polyplax serrata]|uniref:Proline dehydrogenase n=1 Tax=Polyplax serrata TaxID=468196 RepID=A0AAN8S552_POLSC